jgi:hypothetical protein
MLKRVTIWTLKFVEPLAEGLDETDWPGRNSAAASNQYPTNYSPQPNQT